MTNLKKKKKKKTVLCVKWGKQASLSTVYLAFVKLYAKISRILTRNDRALPWDPLLNFAELDKLFKISKEETSNIYYYHLSI